MALTDFDILVPGNYFCDLIFTGLPEFPELGTEIYSRDMQVVPGGGALNSVIALRRLNVHAGWIGVLGNDFASIYIRDWITAKGVDLSMVEMRDTPHRRMTVALSYPEDRAFVTYVDPDPDLLAMTEKALENASCRHLHFPGLVIDERLPDLLKKWRGRGITVSMDCQHRPHTLEIPLVRDIMSQLDMFMPNAVEVMALTQTFSLAEAAEALTPYVKCLVIKDGANGSFCYEGGSVVHAPALSLIPLDTTGAGDVFSGGFLAAHLAGHDKLTCLRWGNVCGGLSTLGYGGASSAPEWDVVMEALEQPHSPTSSP